MAPGDVPRSVSPASGPRRAPVPRPGLSVREAVASDGEGIRAIYNEAVRTTIGTFDTEERSADRQRQWMEDHRPPFAVVVAERGPRLVGWASLSRWSERRAYDATAEVSFYVEPASRGQGGGKALLAEVVRRGERSGLHRLVSRIAQPNPVSVHLHEAVGFRLIGTMTEVGRKFDRWVDVRLYERPLPGAGGF